MSGLGLRPVVLLTLIAAAVACAAPAGAQAAQRYAAPLGSGTACTLGSPCDLDTAVEHSSVADGDEVIVTPGTYAVVNLAIGDAIDLHGQALLPTPTIVGSSATAAVNVFDAATLRGLKIEGTNVGVSVGPNATGAPLERLSVHAGGPGGTACAISDPATVRDTLCWQSGTNSKGLGTSLSTFPGTYTIRLRNVTAVGSSFGVGFDLSSPGVDFQIDAANVIADGGSADIRAAASNGASSTVTLASSNYATEQETTGGGGVSATVTDPGTGGNQTAAPIFVDPISGNFHQLTGSPTIDAGTADSFLGPTDFDGDARTLEGDGVCPTAPDIGADELIGAGPIDCDPPETTIGSGPTGTTSDNTPTFGLASDEPGSTFECKLDGAAFAPCSTPFTTAALADGSHTLEVRATDPSANTDPTPATRAFAVNTSVPADTDPPGDDDHGGAEIQAEGQAQEHQGDLLVLLG